MSNIKITPLLTTINSIMKTLSDVSSTGKLIKNAETDVTIIEYLEKQKKKSKYPEIYQLIISKIQEDIRITTKQSQQPKHSLGVFTKTSYGFIVDSNQMEENEGYSFNYKDKNLQYLKKSQTSIVITIS